MDPLIQKELDQEVLTDFHRQLLENCKQLVKASRNHMTTWYSIWDQINHTYRAHKDQDIQDKKASMRGEPTKQIIPSMYTQVQTFISFAHKLLTQREYFYELIGSNSGNQDGSKLGEAVLERDLNNSSFRGVCLYQLLQDIGKFGLGIVKHSWVEEKQLADVNVTIPPKTVMGIPMTAPRTEVQRQWVTKFKGNRLYNVSPYRFFPDVRLPLYRFQEGEFCASEDDYSYTSLKQMEKDGLVAGTKFIKPLNIQTNEDRRIGNTDVARNNDVKLWTNETRGTCLLTEVQIRLIPSEYLVGGKPMGDEDYPVLYVIWYANDQRIIKCEPMNYDHNSFTYDIGLYAPDLYRFMSDGIGGMIGDLQDTQNWLFNSRITSVRKNIEARFIVDPMGIDVKDIDQRKPIIQLKPGVSRSGVEKWIKQLEVTDVTQSHFQDAQVVQGFIESTTGINQNMLGQFNSGRRSAEEAQNVMQSSTGRVGTPIALIWELCLKRLGEKMLMNLQQGLDEQTYVLVRGIDSVDPTTGAINTEYEQFKPVDKQKIIGQYEFRIYDGTLPSEKGYIAQALQDTLTQELSNPVAAQVFGMNPKALHDEILKLRGVKGLQRFQLPPQLQQILQQVAAQHLLQAPPAPGKQPNVTVDPPPQR